MNYHPTYRQDAVTWKQSPDKSYGRPCPEVEYPCVRDGVERIHSTPF